LFYDFIFRKFGANKKQKTKIKVLLLQRNAQFQFVVKRGVRKAEREIIFIILRQQYSFDFFTRRAFITFSLTEEGDCIIYLEEMIFAK
jgi:hypothetical protein